MLNLNNFFHVYAAVFAICGSSVLYAQNSPSLPSGPADAGLNAVPGVTAPAKRPPDARKPVVVPTPGSATKAAAEPPPSRITLDFHRAFSSGNLELAEMLLKQGADINCVNCYDMPIFTRAVIGQNVNGINAISWMLSHGADPNLPWRDRDNQTPLHTFLATTDFRPITGGVPNVPPTPSALTWLEQFLNAGAKPNQTSSTGATALHYLAVNSLGMAYGSKSEKGQNFIRMTELLVAKGGDINAQDKQGRTPLMATLERDCMPEAISLFKRLGADTQIKARDGTTAKELAYKLAVTGNQRCNQVIGML